jgi:Protein of unknown function (DUF4232)
MRTRLLCTALAIAAALAVTACGGSSSASSTGAARSSSTTSAAVRSSSTATAVQTSTTTAASSTSAAVQSSTTGSTPPCRAAGLALSYLGGQGATGHGELGFAVRNTQSASCNTIGYPGVQFLGKSGEPLPTHPIHTTEDFFGHTKLAEVVVGPGQTASFRLGVTHGATSTKNCTLAYGLQVIPPNDTATLHVSIPDGVLECGTATVSPMQPGTSAFQQG